ncbi:MAG: alanine--tRNA ligase-related protein [Candidatus Falkowbacteria bacterium]|nr:alanine--tRNA ligase-related protein [Candidatus Falkowbacteria bacterium]
MNSFDIRQKYLEFFKARGHNIIPSASLIPENDSTLLFVNSGMFPLVPYLLGAKHPAGNCVVDSQKSFRSEDIDEIGDNRHHTFFEMLGNWALGSGYWKSEQLNWWYEFLVEEIKIDPKKLFQTIYIGSEDGNIPRDTESAEIMLQIFDKYDINADEAPDFDADAGPSEDLKLGMSNYRIFAYEKKCWWQRGDAVGELGGPDSETFFDTGKIHDEKFGKYCHPNCDCGRFIEIGNSVFMQYQKAADGWKELTNKNVDFGGGLERLCTAIQAKSDAFQTDLFSDAIKKIEELSLKKYEDDNKAFRIIADHLKAATFIMGDEKGVAPSNTDQGYIVRRLIRRALRFARLLGITAEDWTKEVASIYINFYKEIYPELNLNKTFIIEQLSKEEKKFSATLEKGEKEFEKLSSNISGEQAFDLYQSYGFPIEMTIELAKEKNFTVDEPGFYEELKKHQDLSRTASAGKFKGGLADSSVETTRLHTASHLLLAALRRVLNDQVSQRGSNITAERLRFDFPNPDKLTPEQIIQVEDLVNGAIEQALPVHFEEMTLDKAREIGATGVFDSKYGDKVKVYFIGNPGEEFSKEICGGPHVENTSELHHFKITKEESSSSGIRRIKAILD